jgi:TATA-box binding protein (TBP) (component of TFIID and TFIIIB)
MDTLTRLTGEFMSMFERIASVETTHIKSTPVQISTMTIAGRYDRGELPIELIREKLAEGSGGELYLAVPKVVKHRKTTVVQDTKMRKFDHQVSFKLGGSSLKVFLNGSVHGTGFASITEFVEMTEMVAQYIMDISGIELQLVDFNINMVNASTSTVDADYRPIQFQMKQLADAFTRDGYHADFDPERHPAVKVMLFNNEKKVSTCFVFPTGSITIFGSKEPEHIATIFEILFKTMDKAYAISSVCSPRKTTLRKPLDISYGYPSSIVKLLSTFVKEA